MSFQTAKIVGQKIKILVERAKNTVELKKIEDKKKLNKKLEAEAKLRVEQQEAALRVYKEREGATIQIQRMVSLRLLCWLRW